MAMEMNKTEKMKKLFADKTLDAEQLENVAGGGPHMTADDSRFLNVLLRGHPDQPNRYGETRSGSVYEGDGICREVEKAWAAVGITCKAYTFLILPPFLRPRTLPCIPKTVMRTRRSA